MTHDDLGLVILISVGPPLALYAIGVAVLRRLQRGRR